MGTQNVKIKCPNCKYGLEVMPDKKNSNLIIVVAAIMIKNNKVFIAQRNKPKDLAGLWEFPGGGKLRQVKFQKKV